MDANRKPVLSYDVAIVGGGFSGTVVASSLLERSLGQGQNLSVVIFEPGNEIGAGVAYRTNTPEHLLNVRTAGMNLSDRPGETFHGWLSANGHSYEPNAFVPRHLYRGYIRSHFFSAIKKAQGLVKLDTFGSEVCSVARAEVGGRFLVSTKDGRSFSVSQVVLALGTLETDPALLGEKAKSLLSAKNPWDENALRSAAATDKVAVLGSGLTAVDTVLALEGRGFKGEFKLFSRRGLLPLPQYEHSAPPNPALAQAAKLLLSESSILGALQIFRDAVADGCNFGELLNTARPEFQQYWQRFSATEKRRFLRHLRPFWEVHRHRAPQESIEKMERIRAQGRLSVVRARVEGLKVLDSGLELLATSRVGQIKIVERFDAAFNCLGLFSDIRKVRSDLLQSMVASGLARYDDLNLGLSAADDGTLRNSNDGISHGLFTLGALRRGDLWETTAVRELKAQAQTISQRIIENLDARRNVSNGTGALSPERPLLQIC